VVAPLGSVTAVRTFSFSVYQKAKYKTSAFIGQVTGEEEPLAVVNKPGSLPDLGTMTCFGVAGATAGALSTLIACK
jgi:solute carrier family 25 (mitochondrial carnitine/acylcarnitine transporter), member 20/29